MKPTPVMMTPFLTLAAALWTSPSLADDCSFSGKAQAGHALTIQCGMTKAALLERIGAPLFYDGGRSSDGGAIENWVFRLTNTAGTPKMVSVKLIGGNVDNIMVSR